ncbi:MAG TPA: hypothetical protein VN033_13165 [Vulgatibacter sp.]|nr:hypothetical protein [Vulgatibacter sp.]
MRSTLAALVLPFAIASCGLASFDVPVKGTIDFKAEDPDTFIPVTDAELEGEIGEIPANLQALDITKQKKFEDSGMSINDVKSLELIALRLKVQGDGTLDFLGKIAFYIEREGLERVEIASGEIKPGDTAITLDTVEKNLIDYAKGTMKLSAIVDRPTHVVSDTKVDVNATFHVEL